MNKFETYRIDEGSYVPKYFQLKEILQKMIKGMKADEIVPSEHQLAEQFKLHRLTARQAITELVNDGLLYRVHGSGTFVSEKKTAGASNTIACIFRNIRPRTEDDNFFLEIFEAFEDELSKNKKFMLYKCLNNMKAEDEIIDTVAEILDTKAGGLVLDERVPDSVISKLNCPDIPIFIIHRKSTVKSVRSIVSDNKSAVSIILEHLTKLGHKRILFIYETNAPNQLEILGEMKNLTPGYGIKKENLMIIPATEKDFSGKSYRNAAAKGLKLHRPTAIIGGSDWVASNSYEEIRKKGLSIPEDVSVISIGGFDISSRLSPPLTAVRIDTQEMGRTAANAVLSPDKYPGDIIIPATLIERASCARSK